jgi:hypothetical protein
MITNRSVVEVPTGSIKAWDRGGTFGLYQGLASLREYVLVSTTAMRVEWFTREEDGRCSYRKANWGSACSVVRGTKQAPPESSAPRFAAARGDRLQRGNVDSVFGGGAGVFVLELDLPGAELRRSGFRFAFYSAQNSGFEFQRANQSGVRGGLHR